MTVNLQGWLTRGLDDVFADLLNPEMQFFKSHLYQLSVRANFPLHFSTLARELQNLLTVCRKRQQIKPNHAWTALCSIVAV